MRRLLLAALIAATPAVAAAQPRILSNRWDADRPSTFAHVVESTPGKKTITLDARSDAAAGQTVSVYPAAPGSALGRLLSVTATAQGGTRTVPLTVPPPPPGQSLTRVPLAVVIENATGRRQTGEYTLTVSP